MARKKMQSKAAPTAGKLSFKDKLKMMKRKAVLINLARGGLVDEVALKKILLENVLKQKNLLL